MQEYIHFPPYKYFIRVLKSCPKSALLYSLLWKKRGKKMSLVVDKKEIRREFLMSPTLFRNLLSPLMFLNIITFMESDIQYLVNVMGASVDE